MPQKLELSSFISRSEKIHNFKFDYSNIINYVNNKTPVEIVCPKHGMFLQLPMNHIKGIGCAKCEDEGRIKTQDVFIKEANILYANKYDYSNSVYISAKEKIKIICPNHGEFYQTPTNHLKGDGYGCLGCLKEHQRYSVQQFIELANIEHDFRYSYDKVKYFGSKVEVLIWCYDHNFYFSQLPSVHLFGHGCPKCGEDSKRLTIREFVDRSIIIHNNRYDYSLVNYVNSYSKVKIKCKKHNIIFDQTPVGHLHGRGCFKCSRAFPKLEDQWLNSEGITEQNKRIIIKISDKIYRTDAYDPATNTVYEFYGDFWHGNPKVFPSYDLNIVNNKTFGALYEKTMNREQELINAGYNVVSIWESDFKALLK
jgi:hypothetical protein